MSIRREGRSAAARRIIALMGRQPRLKIERPGRELRLRWSWERGNDSGYQAWRDRDMERISRIRKLPPEGDRASVVWRLHFIKPGVFFRLVNGHGKAYGRRYQRGVDDHGLDLCANVRVVKRQEEDLHSQLSRMMKRAHRAAMKD